MSIEIKIQ